MIKWLVETREVTLGGKPDLPPKIGIFYNKV